MKDQDREDFVAVIGGGPAGLAAAERIARAGRAVRIFDRMPTPGRKLLMAGRGGLNLTHSEPLDRFIERYGESAGRLAPIIHAFPPDALRDWAGSLGVETFVGSSGRVFPTGLKASPLLRAWRRRLEGAGATIHARHRWDGFDGDALSFTTDGRMLRILPKAIILALGGASWSKLGSDGSWADALLRRGVAVAPFMPSNSGFDALWTQRFADMAAGQPLKNIALCFDGRRVPGEIVLTRTGVEGGAVYALSAALRDAIGRNGEATLLIDLKPDLSATAIRDRLGRPRGRNSLSNHLRKTLKLDRAAIALLREALSPEILADGARLAEAVKALPVRLTGVRPLDRAISSAGGIAWDEMTDDLMVRRIPGLFAAGEMLDWEAPTGGYLLQACFATGVRAGDGVCRYLER
ncbi:TIGR03862 family flavoprotein [Inquilinus sp. CAU 1745]|uniref:TIGR03862 family flavoprotein n=1 Tax=Inquilinus sp. CAU 1745 TaxID=3140369 RepID=UPI00325B2D7B